METQRSTQIALIASVANAYLTLLADQELLALSEATLVTEQESYGLTEHKYRLGPPPKWSWPRAVPRWRAPR